MAGTEMERAQKCITRVEEFYKICLFVFAVLIWRLRRIKRGRGGKGEGGGESTVPKESLTLREREKYKLHKTLSSR